MDRLLLVRHGETAANRDRLVLGRSLDVPLTHWGHRQAGHAAERVAEQCGLAATIGRELDLIGSLS